MDKKLFLFLIIFSLALSKTTTWAKEIHIFTSEVVTTKNFTTLVVKGKSLAPFQVQDKKTPRGYLTLCNEIYRQNPQKGLDYLEAGEKLLKKQPNDSLLTEYYLKKGYIFYIQGDYGKAVAEYTKSLEVSKAINHKKNMGLTYLSLGLIQQGVGRHTQAIRYFEKRIEIYDKEPSSAYLNLGISYLDLNQLDKAEYYFNKSFENRLSSSAKGIQLASRNRIAQMHYLRNRFAEAQKEYTTVIEKAKGDLWELTFAYLGLAEVHLKNNKLDEALENAEKSYELANKMDAFWEKERSTELLSKIYKLQGNYQEANKYLEENANLKDTLFNIEQAEIIALMQLDIQEAENSALISKNQIAENNLLFNQILIFLIVIVLLITLFFVLKFRKIIIEKDQLNLILAEKNLQLTKIDKGKNKLFSIVSHDLRSPIASLTQIMDLLLQNAFSEEEKQEVYSEVRAQLDNSSRMLNNLLIWASTQLNGTKVNFTEVDVIAEMTEILNVYRISSRTKGVHITHNKHKDSLRIQVDKVQLHVILHNLLSNALKYTSKDENICISYKETQEEIELHIFNEGKPISSDKINHILNENLPVTSLKGTDGEFGTGLGLYLIRKYLQLNNAKFVIKGIADTGTLVILYFKKSS